MSRLKDLIEVNNIKEVFDAANLDYSNLLVSLDSQGGHVISYESQLTPSDYLDFAYDDFFQKNNHGYVNAISNIKRCIDCQIEHIIKYFQISVSPKGVKEFYSLVLEDEIRLLSPINLPLLSSLNLSPIVLISKIREIRNTVEHEYKIPQHSQVREALEVAELFLSNIHAKLGFGSEFNIGNNDENYISFSTGHCIKDGELVDGLGYIEGNNYLYNFKGNEVEYLFFLRGMFAINMADYENKKARIILAETIKMLMEFITKIPKEKINITIE